MAAAEAVAQQGWSSLPADLVNRVADCILATNDIDYYMDLRAVCQGWRSSTADPKTSRDVRFHPTRWIVLDELFSDSDTRLFVNATTGRFLRRRLPLLRANHFVASTTGGFFVLAEREPPHAARVLNPFTGSMIRFKAPTPSEVYMAAAVVGVSPTLVLHCTLHSYDDEVRFFLADPDSERFQVVKISKSAAPGDDVESEFLDPALASALLVMRGLVVELAACPGEMLRVERSPAEQGVRLFRMDSHSTNKCSAMGVSSIGGHALFLGASRCVSVLADSFPSVEANCVYYQKEGEDGNSHTYMYDLAHEEEERIMGGNVYLVYPASIIQLLVGYAMLTVRYEPGWDQVLAKLHSGPTRPSMEEELWEVLMYDLQTELEAEGYVGPVWEGFDSKNGFGSGSSDGAAPLMELEPF
jgi:hypothetical protein